MEANYSSNKGTRNNLTRSIWRISNQRKYPWLKETKWQSCPIISWMMIKVCNFKTNSFSLSAQPALQIEIIELAIKFIFFGMIKTNKITKSSMRSRFVLRSFSIGGILISLNSIRPMCIVIKIQRQMRTKTIPRNITKTSQASWCLAFLRTLSLTYRLTIVTTISRVGMIDNQNFMG